MNKTAKNNHRANRHIMRALNLIESQGFGGRTQDKKSFGISNSGQHNESYTMQTLHHGALRGYTFSHIIIPH